MTNVLPSAPAPAPALPVDPPTHRDADRGGESFAGLLDRQATSCPKRDTTDPLEPVEVGTPTVKAAHGSTDEERDGTNPAMAPDLSQQAFWHQPPILPLGEHLLFSPEMLDGLNAVAAGDDAEPVAFSDPVPEDSAGDIPATANAGLTILAALFPSPMVQMSVPAPLLPQPKPQAPGAAPLPQVATASDQKQPAPMQSASVGSLPITPMPSRIALGKTPAIATPPRNFAPTIGLAPTIGSEALPLTPLQPSAPSPLAARWPVAPAPAVAAPHLEAIPVDPPRMPWLSPAPVALAEPALPAASEAGAPSVREAGFTLPPLQLLPEANGTNILTVAETEPATPTVLATAPTIADAPSENSAPKPRGTTAAKRGEVMPNTALQAPPNLRPERSAGEVATVAEPAPLRRFGHSAPVSAMSAPEPTLAAPRVILATAPQQGEREHARQDANPEPRIEIDMTLPASFHAAKPHFESFEPALASAPTGAKEDGPITRHELVQIVERTADAALRMRAIGNERVEIAVRLESGDKLTIQLHLANGEVTPIFRTNSDALRTALEQNWTQFSERAADRSVRLTQPVFDVNQSSSNMTDLSQQRHGRDTAHADRHAELTRHFPNRTRAPRPVAAAVETATAAEGVRLYA